MSGDLKIYIFPPFEILKIYPVLLKKYILSFISKFLNKVFLISLDYKIISDGREYQKLFFQQA